MIKEFLIIAFIIVAIAGECSDNNYVKEPDCGSYRGVKIRC